MLQTAPCFGATSQIVQEVELLRQWLITCEITLKKALRCKIVGEATEAVVESLRKIFVQHKIIDGKMFLLGEDAAALRSLLDMAKVTESYKRILCWNC